MIKSTLPCIIQDNVTQTRFISIFLFVCRHRDEAYHMDLVHYPKRFHPFNKANKRASRIESLTTPVIWVRIVLRVELLQFVVIEHSQVPVGLLVEREERRGRRIRSKISILFFLALFHFFFFVLCWVSDIGEDSCFGLRESGPELES